MSFELFVLSPSSYVNVLDDVCLTSSYVNSDDVIRAVRSFAPGSAGGQDGLRPQHLVDLTDRRLTGSLVEALTEFVNIVLAGGVPEEVRAVFFGASLFAFKKKDGGIRPIAVGLTLRRLVAKVANTKALALCSPFLSPRQLGVGTKGGAEAIAHAARRYLTQL